MERPKRNTRGASAPPSHKGLKGAPSAQKILENPEELLRHPRDKTGKLHGPPPMAMEPQRELPIEVAAEELWPQLEERAKAIVTLAVEDALTVKEKLDTRMVPPSTDVDSFTRIVVDRAAQKLSERIHEMVKQYLFTDAREHVYRAVQDLWVSEGFAESRPTQVTIAKCIPQGFQMGHSTHSKHLPTDSEYLQGPRQSQEVPGKVDPQDIYLPPITGLVQKNTHGGGPKDDSSDSLDERRRNRKRKKRRTKRGTNGEDDSDLDSSDSSSDTSSSSDDDRKYLEVPQLLNDMFTKAVDYRTCRWINKTSEYTQENAQKITKHHKKLRFEMGDTTFTGTDPIAKTEFLQKFKLACDQNGFFEGAAMWLFQFYLKVQAYYLLQGRILGNTLAMDGDGTEMLESYPEVVNFLLETYATDEVIQEAYSEVLAYHQRSGQTESEFSLALWNLATRCGNVFTISRIKSLFSDNVDKAIRSQVRNYLASNRKVDYSVLAGYSQGLGDTLRLGKRPAMPPNSKDKPKRSVLEIEDTTTAEGSSHIKVPTGTAIHLAATQGRFPKPLTVSKPPSMVTRDPQTGGLVCWFCLAIDHLANNCANVPPGMRDQLIQARMQNHQRLYGSSTQAPRTPVQVNTIEETPNLESTPAVQEENTERLA
ncbi:unnamed protein product [Agarophyton chilense]